MLCNECGEKMVDQGVYCTTLVGYMNGECGRKHDDNCVAHMLQCKNKHERVVQVRASCPCGWKGKLTCFCHDGEKVELDEGIT